jgi:hypothetical protein
MLGCAKFVLWDSEAGKLISIAEFHKSKSTALDIEQSLLNQNNLEELLVKNGKA